MDLHEIYLEIPVEEIAYVKFIVESYEGVGIVRTVERKKAIIVLLVVKDFLDVARAVIASLKNDLALVEIPRPDDIGDDWLMQELAATDADEG